MRTIEAGDTAAAPYPDRVAAALSTLGYQVTGQFAEGVVVLNDEDPVIRVSLNGPIVDLVWDEKSWRAITYPDSDSTRSEELSKVLSTEGDLAAEAVAQVAQSVLDEARRRWGGPDPVRTWTFFGRWDNARIVVDVIVPGVVADDREDDGRPARGFVGRRGCRDDRRSGGGGCGGRVRARPGRRRGPGRP